MKAIPTIIWRIESGGVFPIDICTRIAHRASLFLAQAGLRLDIKDVVTMPEPEVSPSMPFHYPGLLRQRVKDNREVYPRIAGRLYHMLTRPIYSGRYAFFGGTAGCVGCPPDQWLTVSSAGITSGLINPTPDDHERSAAYIMAHEVAHCFGASHFTNSKRTGTIMHPYINVWNKHRGLRWAKRSKLEIKKFLESL